MIENERQYQVTKYWITEFEKTLSELHTQPCPARVPPQIHTAMIESIESQLSDFRAEIAEYEALKAQQVRELELKSLSELPDLFIKARLARGYTQADLAKKLNLEPQKLHQYEATRYQSVSFKRLLEIAHALDVDLHETVKL